MAELWKNSFLGVPAAWRAKPASVHYVLTTVLVVKVADPEKSFAVCMDASKEGVGGVLTEEGMVIA